jgi:hypothetical protein
MPTQAIAAYGTELRMGTATSGTVVNIATASNTTPIIVTTSTPHSVVDVDRMLVAGVLGNLGANGEWTVSRVSATQLRLRGSVGTGAYTSGGTITPVAVFTRIAELVNLEPTGLTLRMVPVDAHDGNGWSSSIPTHKEGPAIRVTLNLVPDHVTHDEVTGLLSLALGKLRRNWLVVFPDVGRAAMHFLGYITAHTTVTPVDGVLRATPVLTPDGRVDVEIG